MKVNYTCGTAHLWISGSDSFTLPEFYITSHSFNRYGWVLSSLKNYSNKTTNALFHLTLYSHSRGLSRSGKDMLSSFGWGLASRTFLNLLGKRTELYQQALRHSLLQLPHAIWIDNYNKGYRQLMCSLDKGSYLRIDGTSLVLVLLAPGVMHKHRVQPGKTCHSHWMLLHFSQSYKTF